MQRHWDFDIVIEDTFENVNCIHPLKQRDVLEIVRAAEKDNHVKEVIVFGSSVRFDCNSYSDIDIFVDRDDKVIKSPVDYDKVQSDVDIIFSWKCGLTLLTEIKNTGVVVFRR